MSAASWRCSVLLRSLNEPGELLQWLCDDDSTINIVMSITTAIVITIIQSIATRAICEMRHLSSIRGRTGTVQIKSVTVTVISVQYNPQSAGHNHVLKGVTPLFPIFILSSPPSPSPRSTHGQRLRGQGDRPPPNN